MSRPLRILIVSQMYPGPGHPDLGVFVQTMHAQLAARGHDVHVVAVRRRGGSRLKHLTFGVRVLWASLRLQPDVMYAHFLAPAGVWAALGSMLARCSVVPTAHGRDVRNIGAIPGVRAAMRLLGRRAEVWIAVSDYLRQDLERRLPWLAGRVRVIDSGIDLDRFRPAAQEGAREQLGWPPPGYRGEPAFVFVGTLDERKNVLRLAAAVENLGSGSLAVVGDGPLRAQLEGRERVRVVGRVPHAEVATWLAAGDVLCLPSMVEPFGQVLLEAMACERSVLATRVGGPPEFVTPAAGVLVDPLSEESIEAGLRQASKLACPNPAAREAAAAHDVRVQAGRVEEVLVAAAERSGAISTRVRRRR